MLRSLTVFDSPSDAHLIRKGDSDKSYRVINTVAGAEILDPTGMPPIGFRIPLLSFLAAGNHTGQLCAEHYLDI
jgi:hypothetical protein